MFLCECSTKLVKPRAIDISLCKLGRGCRGNPRCPDSSIFAAAEHEAPKDRRSAKPPAPRLCCSYNVNVPVVLNYYGRRVGHGVIIRTPTQANDHRELLRNDGMKLARISAGVLTLSHRIASLKTAEAGMIF
jgi:hypothetical protein